jgi:hypothetical protein
MQMGHAPRRGPGHNARARGVGGARQGGLLARGGAPAGPKGGREANQGDGCAAAPKGGEGNTRTRAEAEPPGPRERRRRYEQRRRPRPTPARRPATLGTGSISLRSQITVPSLMVALRITTTMPLRMM